MRFFFISAVGFTVVLLIFFAVKATIRAALWKEFERSEAASASAGQVSASSSPVQTSQGANAVQDQKGSRRVESGGVSPIPAALLLAQLRGTMHPSRPQHLRLLPAKQAGRVPYRKKCGPIAITSGWCFARTIGLISA